MNYNFNDVEKFIREGGSAEEIANAFADKLNLAIATVEAQNTLAEKSDALVDAWCEFVDEYFKHKDMPKNTTIKDWYISKGEVIKLFDMLVKVLPAFDKYGDAMRMITGVKSDIVNSTEKTVKVNKDKFEDVMNDFFNKIGL